MLIRLPSSFCFNMSANVSFLKSVFIISGAGHFYFPRAFVTFLFTSLSIFISYPFFPLASPRLFYLSRLSLPFLSLDSSAHSLSNLHSRNVVFSFFRNSVLQLWLEMAPMCLILYPLSPSLSSENNTVLSYNSRTRTHTQKDV